MPKNEVEEVCRLPNGGTLYRRANGVGGFEYTSDEVGGGVYVWDTSLVAESTLLAALTEEHRRVIAEYHAKAKAKRDANATQEG